MSGTDPFFSEQAYLSANPDVAAAVSSGGLASGWRHYLAFGRNEGRDGVSPDCRGLVKALFAQPPLAPPERLIQRVHGSADVQSFNENGRVIALDVALAVRPWLGERTPLRVLDFGCGCGRVLVPMTQLFPAARFLASDIDGEALAWLAKSSPGSAELVHNSDLPPLPLEEGSVDAIYSISVLTHLPVAMQDAWMKELHRVCRTGGIVAMTSASEALILPHLNDEQKVEFARTGVYYGVYGQTEGLPEYYQAAWHRREYMESHWADIFEVVSHLPRGVANHQDLTVFRKK
ncbi:class I SAM-dependent methyltransferase [Nibricoccus sp. IMCC34717]|uniref:class I SAM-dependent methyltransferase n=1 Tax=Nibricoccus sp. IMCC34717 TaxID=3034021 RepID=UPI00384E10F1